VRLNTAVKGMNIIRAELRSNPGGSIEENISRINKILTSRGKREITSGDHFDQLMYAENTPARKFLEIPRIPIETWWVGVADKVVRILQVGDVRLVVPRLISLLEEIYGSETKIADVHKCINAVLSHHGRQTVLYKMVFDRITRNRNGSQKPWKLDEQSVALLRGYLDDNPYPNPSAAYAYLCQRLPQTGGWLRHNKNNPRKELVS
jgi:hypothetical protein